MLVIVNNILSQKPFRNLAATRLFAKTIWHNILYRKEDCPAATGASRAEFEIITCRLIKAIQTLQQLLIGNLVLSLLCPVHTWFCRMQGKHPWLLHWRCRCVDCGSSREWCSDTSTCVPTHIALSNPCGWLLSPVLSKSRQSCVAENSLVDPPRLGQDLSCQEDYPVSLEFQQRPNIMSKNKASGVRVPSYGGDGYKILSQKRNAERLVGQAFPVRIWDILFAITAISE